MTILKLIYLNLHTEQDRKQVFREARKVIHIRKNNPALNYNTGRINIPKILTKFGAHLTALVQMFLQTLMTKIIIILLLAITTLILFLSK